MFGIDYNALFQVATESPGEEAIAGGVLGMFGQWELIGRDTENTGTFVLQCILGGGYIVTSWEMGRSANNINTNME